MKTLQILLLLYTFCSFKQSSAFQIAEVKFTNTHRPILTATTEQEPQQEQSDVERRKCKFFSCTFSIFRYFPTVFLQ